MATARSKQDFLGQAGQNLLRILIASYFIAVSIGLIAGTDGTPLVGAYLPPEPAALIGRSSFFILGYLVLTGIWLRPAAMLLGIIMFWSSYILNFGPQATAPLGDFWRDLALLGALMLTYTRLSPWDLRLGALMRRVPEVAPATALQPRHTTIERPINISLLPTSAERSAHLKQTENIFRDDLEDMLAS